MPFLTFYTDNRELFVYTLPPSRTLIGRSDRCDVALPSDAVSRTHCVIELRPDGWWVTNRSRAGTWVQQRPIDRQSLADGDVLTIGPYQVRFSTASHARSSASTLTIRPGFHEELIEAADGSVTTMRAEIQFTDGPLKHTSRLLQRPRVSLGGAGSDIVADELLPRGAIKLRVVRGRVIVEPGEVPLMLEGTPVRELTPVLPGEEVRLGACAFTVVRSTAVESDDSLQAFGDLVGRTKLMRTLFGQLARIAAHQERVLITGESGTGKELAARALHDAGSRADGPFIAINCAAIAETLVESELFGHEKGAFTGATGRQDGAFQQAHRGTLFLDEVGELRPDIQAKLLRALESGEVRRIGGRQPEYPDVRVIAATHRNLQDMVKAGTFRSDLFFRLAVLAVRMPALREHRDDIPAIARALLTRSHPSATLTDAAVQALMNYDWPGNVREMRNALTRSFVMGGNEIDASTLLFHPWAFDGERPTTPLDSDSQNTDRKLLVDALARHGGNRTSAARELGMPRSTLLHKLRKHGLEA
jgi:transcriptional regulator with AAA-type ATPase domain